MHPYALPPNADHLFHHRLHSLPELNELDVNRSAVPEESSSSKHLLEGERQPSPSRTSIAFLLDNNQE
jgi:hypothetical protein